MSQQSQKTSQTMKAYAMANLRNVRMGRDIVEYLERIDATLEPYGGRFIIHGGTPERVEGGWDGTPIVIEFPDVERLREWYDSSEYQAILPLRTRNSEGDVIIVEGVDHTHKATDVLA